MIKTLLCLVLISIIPVNRVFSMEMENTKQLSSQNLHQGEDLREIEQKKHSLDGDSEQATMRALAELEVSDIESTTLNSTAQAFFNAVNDDHSATQEDKYNAYKQAVYMTKLKAIEDEKKLKNLQDKSNSILNFFDNKYVAWGGMLAGTCFFGFILKNYSTALAELTKTVSNLSMQNTIETIVKGAVDSLQTTDGQVSTATMFSMQALMPLLTVVEYKPTL